jgi:probable HAF family extracellular repeat protein
MLVLGAGMAGAAIAGPVSYDFTSISFPGSPYTSAQGVNNAGDVVGYCLCGVPLFAGFLLDTTGHFQKIEVPFARNTYALGINNSGEIVGSYEDIRAPGSRHGFLDNNGVFTTIDVPGNTYTEALGINSSGQIVGYSRLSLEQGTNSGFVYENGVFTTIAVPGFHFTGGRGINDAGNVVGTTDNPPSRNSLSFLDVNGSITFIDVGLVNGINNARDIVGNSTSGGSGGFLLDVNGSVTTIELPGASFTTTNGINDQGVIVGTYSGGDCASIYYCGYIGTPVPEPSFLGLVGAILLAFAASLRRVGRWSTGLTSGATRILSRLR